MTDLIKDTLRLNGCISFYGLRKILKDRYNLKIDKICLLKRLREWIAH